MQQVLDIKAEFTLARQGAIEFLQGSNFTQTTTF
jgi:hypothetical protein